MPRAFAEIAFTPEVLAFQDRLGSARAYAGLLAPEADSADRIGPREAAFIAARDSFYQASVSQTGWPYVQHRGGPAGFLKILDDKTIAYADFRGNRQYLSAGNISVDPRISLILMDYPNRRRLKIWGRASLSEDPETLRRLHEGDGRASAERAVLIAVEALDWNCPQHIARRLSEAEMVPVMRRVMAPLEAEIARLTAENENLRAQAGAGDMAD